MFNRLKHWFRYYFYLLTLLTALILITIIIGNKFIDKRTYEKADAAAIPTSITKRVLVLNFDPIWQSNKPLTSALSWNNPITIQDNFINDIRTTSHNYANYQVVNIQTIRDYPVKISGRKFTKTTYQNCVNNPLSSSFCDEGIDYLRLINDYNICNQVNSGTIDEVWLWGGPWFGYWEAVMSGPGAIITNGPAIVGTNCNRKFHIMGFNYERGVETMLESFGHRVEGTLKYAYGGWNTDQTTEWNRFTLLNKDANGKSSCGNIHLPYNGLFDYDFSNKTSVLSRCEDWLNFPSTKGEVKTQNCDAWSCTHYGYMKYWLTHLPYRTGMSNNRHNNWWYYVMDFDQAIKPVNYTEKWYTILNSGYDYNTSCLNKTNANEIYLGVNSGCVPQKNYTAVLVFPNVQILKNSKISLAYLEFVTDGPYSNPITESITVGDGVTTSSPISWAINKTWIYNNLIKSPNLSQSVQQLVNSSSWASGKTMIVRINHISGTGHRRFLAFDREVMASAKLVIQVSP